MAQSVTANALSGGKSDERLDRGDDDVK